MSWVGGKEKEKGEERGGRYRDLKDPEGWMFSSLRKIRLQVRISL